jgi:hypothetical protein
MTDNPIPRRIIKGALIALDALKNELQEGLTDKGFVSKHYLDEKYNDFNREMKAILERHSQEVEAKPANLANTVARSGYDRCVCGCKYFELDKCIDCRRHVTEIPVCAGAGCEERAGGKNCWEHEG